MRKMGLEPTRYCYHKILSLARLPVPTLPLAYHARDIISFLLTKVNQFFEKLYKLISERFTKAFYRIQPQLIARNSPRTYMPRSQMNTPMPARNRRCRLSFSVSRIDCVWDRRMHSKKHRVPNAARSG